MPSRQDEALAAGHLTYNSGKPCQAGHVGDRYTSNGMCIECTKIKGKARATLRKAAVIRRNNALFSQLTETKYMVRTRDRDIMQRLADVLQFGNDAINAQVRQFAESLYAVTKIPRSLTRDDLLTFMEYSGGYVRNYKALTIIEATDEDPNVYFVHNEQRYRADHAMDVLRGLRFLVNPR